MTQPTPTPETDPRTARLVFLWVAGVAVAATGLAILSWLDAERLFTPPRVFGSFLASGVAVCGSGVIVQFAVEQITRAIGRIGHRVDQLEAKLDEQRQEGYAAGYVDGAAGGRRHLTAVPRG